LNTHFRVALHNSFLSKFVVVAGSVAGLGVH
jgi:hypothetical protein